MALDLAGEFKLEQNSSNLPRRGLRCADQFVDGDRRRPQQFHNAHCDFFPRWDGRRRIERRRKLLLNRVDFGQKGSVIDRGARGRGASKFGQIEFVPQRDVRLVRKIRFRKAKAMVRREILIGQGVQHILRLGAESRAIAQQIIRAFRARIERRAGNREDFAALLGGKTRSDQRTRTARRLNDYDSAREPGDNAVASRKVAAARLPGKRHFADRGAMLQQALQQSRVIGRINIA